MPMAAYVMCWSALTVVFLPTMCPGLAGDTCDVDGLSCDSDHADSAIDSAATHEVLSRIPERVGDVDSSDVFFSIKTAGHYHESRLSLLLLTWFQTVNPINQVHVVTDLGAEDQWTDIAKRSGVAVLGADCPGGHKRQSLCCKSGMEYEQYYSALENGEKYSWFCHFDDDIYVNVPALMTTLHRFNPADNLYLGRWSVNKKYKLEIPEHKLDTFPGHKRSSFYFATGAAYCISSPLMLELEPYLRGESFVHSGEKLKLPDDMTIGAIIDAVLGYDFTEVENMRSHLTSMRTIRPEALVDLATFSYGVNTVKNRPPIQNILNIPDAVFSVEEDPTRFLSFHCIIYPKTSWCVPTKH